MAEYQMFCFHCMAALSQPDQVCPECGHDNKNRSNGQGYLSACVLADQYVVGRVLGQGGFGVTYLGFDLNLNCKIAIKEYYPKELTFRDQYNNATLRAYSNAADDFHHGRQRALQEGRMVARLGSSANIVQVFNVFACNDTVYTIMKYIPGPTLAAKVEQNGPMKWNEAYRLLRPLMQSLSRIHAQNVIHRDISPDNIIVNSSTNDPVLLDFGAAHMYQDVKGHSYTLRPGYAPAEQYSGITEQDGRTDEYALCATMYFLLTGKKPMDATQRAFGDTPMDPPSKYVPDIPSEFEKVLLKGMAVHAVDRYPSMDDLIEAFEKVLEQPKPEPVPVKKNLISLKAAAIFAGIAALILAAALIAVSLKGDPSAHGTAPTFTASPPPTPIPAKYRVLRSDVRYKSNGTIDTDVDTVMGTSILREQVSTVTFQDSLDGMTEQAWNVSEDENGVVMMWVKKSGNMYHLYFGAEGGVILPKDSAGLFCGYSSVTSIDFGSAVDTSNVTTMLCMFFECSNLTSLDLSSFDTSNVTDMEAMFYDCYALTSLDLSSFDTSNVTDMDWMFSYCSSLTSLGLSSFDTSNVTNMLYMFYNCYSLTSLDLSSFDTSSATSMYGMFFGCSGLTSLDLTSFDTSNVTDMSYMFYECSKLRTITVSDSFKIAQNKYNMFWDCGTDRLTYK